jgi:hypothetical protein
VSRRNKVNKDAYTQRGRLTPDEMARERKQQAEISARAKGREGVIAGTDNARPSATVPTRRRTGRG